MSAFAQLVKESPVRESPTPASPAWLDGGARTTQLLFGEASLRAYIPAIEALRRRAAQQEDLTTDPQYFLATNALKGRRPTVVLIRRAGALEACVYFFEHCRLGIGLGLCRGGDGIGEGLVAGGPHAWRLHYIDLAVQALLQHWRIHGVSLAILAHQDHCLAVMGPEDRHRWFSPRTIACKLPLQDTYRAMLESLGPRTRRSLAGKRRQLEATAQVEFLPHLDPALARQAMTWLQPRSRPERIVGYYDTRCDWLRARPDFFCTGLRLPDGTWLSVLSGWRRHGVTYVDLQMNDRSRRKESLSAVMRAYLLEHEITRRQHLIYFVGGTSLLLRRYCRPIEAATYAFLWRPTLRARLFQAIVPLIRPQCVYQRLNPTTSKTPLKF